MRIIISALDFVFTLSITRCSFSKPLLVLTFRHITCLVGVVVMGRYQVFLTARCTLVQSVVLRSHVVCPSVRDVGGSGPHRSEILETQCTDNKPNTFALRNSKATRILPGEHGEILRKLEAGCENKSVLEHKSGNISETCKDRGKVTMGSL